MNPDESNQPVDEKDDNPAVEPQLTAESIESPSDQATVTSPAAPENTVMSVVNESEKPQKKSFGKKKLLVIIPLIVALIAGIIGGIPFTRYKVLGLVLKRSVEVYVSDSTTGAPVSEADVTIDGKSAKTNQDGLATVGSVHVGTRSLVVSKKYYKDTSSSQLVKVGKTYVEQKLQATGRQVQVSVTSKLNGSAIEGAQIKTDGTSATTNKDGKATIVLAADASKIDATVVKSGFVDAKVSITVTEAVAPENSFSIVPSGRVYFLSNQTGTIDVVSTNLDGSDRKTVLAGTGEVVGNTTFMIPTSDWKYLAFFAQQNTLDETKMYVFNTDTGELTVADQGKAQFPLIAWSGHSLIYNTNRSDRQWWQAGQHAIKSYDADADKITILDETKAEGDSQYYYVAESIGLVRVLIGEVVYSKSWSGNNYAALSSKSNGIYSIDVNGENGKTVKELPLTGYEYGNTMYLSGQQNTPDSVLFSWNFKDTTDFFRFKNGTIETDTTMTTSKYNSGYKTYYVSPNNMASAWTEVRDGKTVVLVADGSGENAKTIEGLSDYYILGWYSEDMLLLEKSNSEMYIISKDGLGSLSAPLKISDYYTFAGNHD